MSKLILSNTPYKTTIDELKGLYKGIPIAIFADRDQGFAKALASQGFTVETFLSPPENPLPEHFRVIISAGGLKMLNAAKCHKGDRELIVVSSMASRECFSNTCILDDQNVICGTPKLVVIDNRLQDKATCIANLMTLLTDACDILMTRLRANQGLAEFREEAIEALLMPKSVEQLINLIYKGQRVLTASGAVGACSAVSFVNCARLLESQKTFCDFFSAYLINCMLFRFTFFKNNGILLGADRVRIRPLMEKPAICKNVDDGLYILRDKEKGFALTAEELRAIAFNFRINLGECGKRPKIADILDNILIAYESFCWDGLTNVLIGQGFIEGIRNGITS